MKKINFLKKNVSTLKIDFVLISISNIIFFKKNNNKYIDCHKIADL